ncbi:MAG TPA: iron-sulfur cluster repair protein YtfE [Myxococcaceae bacterium]|nr:iron-sulfur cluster repair protein YtfE [Myxococcaceae bacterium]
MIGTKQTLGELAATVPTAAKVFYRYGLDYCCGGRQSLADACEESGLDAAEVLAAIRSDQAALQAPGEGDAGWLARPLADLVQHILERYHAPLREELPRLVALARRVEQVHAGKPGCPVGLAEQLRGMRPFVEAHLLKEEQILFPLILSAHRRRAAMPIQVMLEEHDGHGAALRRIRALTGDLRLPEGACATWRELYRALGELEVELMEHIHLENNVLFPRALAG